MLFKHSHEIVVQITAALMPDKFNCGSFCFYSSSNGHSIDEIMNFLLLSLHVFFKKVGFYFLKKRSKTHNGLGEQ